jgi:MFS family permease
MRLYWRLLRNNPEFAKLWLAQVISLTGDWFNTVVLSTLVSLYTAGSGLALSLFLLARFVPPLLVAPYAGVLIDRFNRKHLMIWSNILRFFVVPFYLFAQSADTLWVIYVVSVMQFGLSAVFEPAQSAILPAMLRDEDLITGNTFMSVTWSAMLAFGAAAGGVVAVLFGTNLALVFDALTFLLAGLLIMWAQYDPHKMRQKSKEVVDTSFREGIRYIRRTPSILSTLLVKGATGFFSADTVMAVLATQVFVLGAKGEISLSIMYSVFGVGAFLGPIVLNRYDQGGSLGRLRQFILWGFVANCLGWLVMSGSPTLLIFCVGIFLRGIGGSVNWTFSSVMIQKIAPDAYLGRMFSLDFAIFQICTVLGTLIHGAWVDIGGIAGIPTMLLITSILCLLPLFTWFNWVARPKLKNAVGD